MSIHVVIEAVGVRHGGGATVLLDLLRMLLADPRVGRITVFASPTGARQFEFPVDSRLIVAAQIGADRQFFRRLLWYFFGLRRAVRSVHGDVVLCFGGMGTSGGTQVAFIQQSLPFCHEARSKYGLTTRLHINVLGWIMHVSARASRVVIVQTPTMAAWVRQQFGIAESKTIVAWPVPPDVQPDKETCRTLDPLRTFRGERFLYVGNVSPYKNLTSVFKGMQLLRQTHPEATLFATCTKAQLRQAGTAAVALGPLSSSAVAEAYRLACILIMPSLVETVGLPMLEAMAAGTPILAADRPYAHDICGDAALFFDPLDPADFASKAAALLHDDSLRDCLRHLGLRRVQELAAASNGAFADALVACI